jgi:hypothetical protein
MTSAMYSLPTRCAWINSTASTKPIPGSAMDFTAAPPGEATPGNGTPAVNWVAYGWPAGRLSAV